MVQLRGEFLCTLSARVAPPREIGETPRGHRRFFAVAGGTFEGPRLRGEVLPEGGDWLLVRPDGVIELDVRATLRTDDGALIYVRNTGLRRASPEVQARLARGEAVDPADYYFRVAPVFDTAAPRYACLNSILAVGIGERLPDGVRYAIFEVL
jgi:hypothetical protein